MSHLERTLVLIKPDGVARGLVGRILSRFEDAGLKIIGMKMQYVSKEHALKHYDEDIERRHSKKVREVLVEFLQIGPIIALVLEGVNAIENVRKIVGPTEPRTAQPGTIRGDFSHVSYEFADKMGIAIKNLIHASADKEYAAKEVNLWFKKDELHSYLNVHDLHVLE